MEWDKWGLFISLVTPLVLGIGAWINDALTKRKKSKAVEKVPHGLPIEYETEYINLLKKNLADARAELREVKAENKQLRKDKNNG